MIQLLWSLPRLLALLALLVPLQLVHAESSVELHIESEGERLRLLFVWGEPVSVLHDVDGRELVLRFSRALPPSLVADIETRTGGWVDWATIGYDSLLLHAGRSVRFQVQMEDDTHVAVDLIAQPEPALEQVRQQPPQQREATALRLARLEALWLAETGELFAARRELADLHEQYPEKAELLSDMASIEARLGQWQQAVTYYNRALSMGQQDSPVIAAKAGLLYEYGPQIRLDLDWQQLHDADWQYIKQLRGRTDVGDWAQLGFLYEHRSIRDNELRRINGPLGSFAGERDYLQLFVQKHFAWAANARLSLSGGNGNAIGFRAEYSQRLDLARVWVDADYHARAWEYVEGVVDGGTVDRLTVGWERPGRDGWRRPVEEALSTYISASVQNYGVEDDNSVAASYGVKLGVRLLLQEMAPRLSVGYQLDLEERTSVDTRYYGGVAYHPLPVVSRQVHSVDAMWFDRLSDFLRYEAGAGVRYDPRNDAGGPYVAATLAYEPWLGLEAGLKFIHSAGPYRGEYARYTRAGGYLLWRF